MATATKNGTTADRTEQLKKLVTKAALCKVGIDALQTDPSYQRGIKPKHKKIVAEFNEEALGIPLVGQREDNSLWIVDGLQRITALKKMGWKVVRAEVFRSKGPEHEAEVFKLVNLNRTKLSPQEEFRALLTAHDERAWAIKDAVEACGYELMLYAGGGGRSGTSDDRASLQVGCVSAMAAVARKKGVEPIKFALLAAKECWPGDRLGCHNQMMLGLCAFHARHDGVVDTDRLYSRLKGVTPHKIIYQAQQANISGDKQSAVAEVIEKVYRKRRGVSA